MPSNFITPAEFVYTLSMAAIAIGIGMGMFLYLPFAPRRDGLPPIFFCTEAFSFVSAGAIAAGGVFIITMFSMSLTWLSQNASKLWPVLPAAVIGILIGFLANRYKQRRVI